MRRVAVLIFRISRAYSMKELRAHSVLFPIFAGILVLFPVLISRGIDDWSETPDLNSAFLEYLAFLLVALLLGVATFGSEMDDGSHRFTSALPWSPSAHWLANTAFAVVATMVLDALIILAAVLTRGRCFLAGESILMGFGRMPGEVHRILEEFWDSGGIWVPEPLGSRVLFVVLLTLLSLSLASCALFARRWLCALSRIRLSAAYGADP